MVHQWHRSIHLQKFDACVTADVLSPSLIANRKRRGGGRGRLGHLTVSSRVGGREAESIGSGADFREAKSRAVPGSSLGEGSGAVPGARQQLGGGARVEGGAGHSSGRR
jgi:hypothetical protein